MSTFPRNVLLGPPSFTFAAVAIFLIQDIYPYLYCSCEHSGMPDILSLFGQCYSKCDSMTIWFRSIQRFRPPFPVHNCLWYKYLLPGDCYPPHISPQKDTGGAQTTLSTLNWDQTHYTFVMFSYIKSDIVGVISLNSYSKLNFLLLSLSLVNNRHDSLVYFPTRSCGYDG